jgi:hypothetical protein
MPAAGRRPDHRSLARSPVVPLAVALVALGAAAVWWSARGPRGRSHHGGAATFDVLSAESRRDPVATVSSLVGRNDPETMHELVEIYSKWASYPETLQARKMALGALLAHPDPRIGLEAVLTAVEGDQTRRGQDPMWSTLVSSVAKLLNATTFQMGRDRYYIEERAKPKDLLLESLAAIDPQTLTQEQRTQLAADLIDLHPSLLPAQIPAVDAMLTALAGNDVVEILAGRGLGEDSNLQLVAERNRAIAAARAIPLPPPVQEDDKP